MYHPEPEDKEAATSKRSTKGYHLLGCNPLIVERPEFKPYVWRGLDNPQARRLAAIINKGDQ
jgi:hypothetical protein